MVDAPVYECPQCGQRLRRSSAITCPACGYLVTAARIKHEAAVRYWRYMIVQSRLEVLLVLLWFAAIGLAYWVISLQPGWSLFVIALLLAFTFTALGKFLKERRKRRT